MGRILLLTRKEFIINEWKQSLSSTVLIARLRCNFKNASAKKLHVLYLQDLRFTYKHLINSLTVHNKSHCNAPVVHGVKNMKHSTIWLLIFILLGGGAGYYIWQQNQEQAQSVAVEPQTLVLPEEPPEPAIKYPVPEPPVRIDTEVSPPAEEELEEPLPPLGESDSVMQEEFAGLFDQSLFGKLFIFKTFIHRFVVTVDNLTATKLPNKFRFSTPPPDSFIVNKNTQDKIFIDPGNYRRYSVYIKFIEAMDTKALAEKYVHYYPLFQEAYENLGYPDQYFNDRLIEVIDHLLDTPDIVVPIELIRPNVFYQFADPRLEALSAGQKILIRMGYDNAFRVKAKLKELRKELTTLKIDF